MRYKLIFIIFLLCFGRLFSQDLQKPTGQSFHQQEAAFKNKIARAILGDRIAQTESQLDFDVTYYKLDLKIDPQTEIISGQVTMEAVALTSGLQQIDLDLHHIMKVDSVVSNSGKLSFTRPGDLLVIQWPSTLEANQSFALKVFYKGTPEQTYFGAFVFDTFDGQPMIWSLSEPFGARNWWPCKDAPADKADSVDIVVTVPSQLTDASNGTLRSVSEQDGWKTFWWHESYPIATYLVSVAIYPYYAFTNYYVSPSGDSMPILNYVFPRYKSSAEKELPKCIRMLEIFSDLFGPYPFFREKFGHAQFTWGGGMEHQTITSLVYFDEGLVAHELAHQWWGDMITCDTYNHIWLNEGFATYCEALYLEKSSGMDQYHQQMAGTQYFGDGTIYVYDPLHDEIFDGNLSYNKGSWVLHMLRHVVGDDVFFNILQTYYKDPNFQYGTATTEGFRTVCEQVTGMNLERFFQQWIYEPGYPTYLFSWKAAENPNGTFTISGMLDQSTDGRIFWMPVDVTVRTASQETTIVVLADDAANSFSCTVAERPVDVVVDKDNWILNKVQTVSGPAIQFAGSVLAERIGNGNSLADAGEQIELKLKFSNSGARANDLRLTLSSLDQDISFLQNTVEIDSIPTGGQPAQTAEPMLLNIAAGASSHRAILTVTVQGDDVEPVSFNFTLPIGPPNVLFVSDAANAAEVAYAKTALDSGAIHAMPWDINSLSVPSLDTVQTFTALVYNTGSRSGSVLSPEEIALLQSYIDQGGKLLIAGQNIAAFLNESEGGKAFLADYLGSSFYQDTFSGVILKGLTDVPMTSGVFIRFIDASSDRTQESPDVLMATGNAETVLQYMPGNGTAGIRVQRGSARIAYFAFGLEALKRRPDDSSNELLLRTMQWLQGNEVGAPPGGNSDAMPERFSLLSGYPNPFNPGIRISFTLPVTANVELAIYNSKGQRSKLLRSEVLSGGIHSIEWDGRDQHGVEVASGVYFVRMVSEGFQATQKILKLK
jgi:aminopeptidase N